MMPIALSILPFSAQRIYSYEKSRQPSHELILSTFLAFSYACLRNNRLGGRLHYGQPITQHQETPIRWMTEKPKISLIACVSPHRGNLMPGAVSIPHDVA